MEGREVMGWQHLLDLSLVWEIRDRGSIEIGMHEHLLHLGRNISSTPREDGRRIWNDSEKALEVLSSDSVDDMKKCEGLPLSLEVVGTYLRKESKKLHLVPKDTRQQVISALEYQIPMSYFDGRLWAKLRLSYYALDEVERDMFLDVATVFYKSDLSTAKAAWRVVTKRQQDMKWQRLVDLSLVWEIRDQEKTEIGMQAQLQSLVKRIASVRGANGRRVWNDRQCESIRIVVGKEPQRRRCKDFVGFA